MVRTGKESELAPAMIGAVRRAAMRITAWSCVPRTARRAFSTAASRAHARQWALQYHLSPAMPSPSMERTLYTHIAEPGFDEERRLHEYLVAAKYEAGPTQQFYSKVLGDGTGAYMMRMVPSLKMPCVLSCPVILADKRAMWTGNLHFGKWDGIDAMAEGAFSKASMQLTRWMWHKAMCKIDGHALQSISYIDLGAGNGCAARMLCQDDARIHATCINIARSQNEANAARLEREGLQDRITVKEGTFMDMPDTPANSFDGCFSQDAMLHAFSKEGALREALRITRPGGFLVLCDLQSGNKVGAPEGGDHLFVGDESQAPDMLMFDTDIVTGSQKLVEAAHSAGWCEVEYVDMSEDLRHSYLVMGRKVTDLLESGEYAEDCQLLPTLKKFQQNLYARVDQVERGVFVWGLLLARKSPLPAA